MAIVFTNIKPIQGKYSFFATGQYNSTYVLSLDSGYSQNRIMPLHRLGRETICLFPKATSSQPSTLTHRLHHPSINFNLQLTSIFPDNYIHGNEPTCLAESQATTETHHTHTHTYKQCCIRPAHLQYMQPG